MYHLDLGDSIAELGDDEIEYLNALGQKVYSFADALGSYKHAELSHRIEREASAEKITNSKIMDQTHALHYAISEADCSEDEAIKLITPGLNGNMQLAEKVYLHVKFIDAVGKSVMAHGLATLMIQGPNQVSPSNTQETLRAVLKEMDYGDWEIKTMMERSAQAIKGFSIEYLQGRSR